MRGQDYGPEIAADVRVRDVLSGRIGTVLAVEEGCHWNCRESESLWRPRAAYILWDNETPSRGLPHPSAPYDDLRGSYVAPEILARVPDGWLDGIGVHRANPVRFFGDEASVRRDGCMWHLMNKRERGWMSSSFSYSTIGELLVRWGARFSDVEAGRVVSHQDRHGIFWRVRHAYETAQREAA